MFWCILDLFRYCTKLGAKRVELVQLMKKFVPWNRIRVFRNERTRSTPLEPNSCSGAFRSVSVHLAMFRYFTELGAKWVELVQLRHKLCHEVALEFFATNTLDPPHWNLNCSIGAFRTVWVHFGFVSLLHKTRCKTGWTGAINAKVRGMKSHWNFLQRTHPIHPIGP